MSAGRRGSSPGMVGALTGTVGAGTALRMVVVVGGIVTLVVVGGEAVVVVLEVLVVVDGALV